MTNRRHLYLACIALAIAWLAFCIPSPCAVAQEKPEPVEPEVAPASREAERAMQGFQLPEGFEVRLFAAEPDLANPIAFDIDHRGRFWICETFRQSQGVTDNRNHDQAWLMDDLAAQTVEDRAAYYRKHLGEKALEYMLHDDRVRLVEDTDGDGRADSSVVFDDHFNDLVEGSGAGVLARNGNVYYANIPHLWLLRDEDGDGRADQRKSLHYGYGVRTAFRGHDMHGLIIGPDGKLYFSIGDRGYNVLTAEGARLADPESGAVFRCNLDGSKLEVIHTGLRNPQELAFDAYGNLFTGDNNSDSGDEARLVYIVEGGDSGWRMSYQYLSDRGPFNRENIWHPYPGASPEASTTQPAYIVPPIENIADGPSGLAYYPGVGLPEQYDGCFFLCDFRGTPANSGVRTFRVEPQGASFTLVDQQQTIWSVLATDVAFGLDGAIYISDWVDGWTGTGKGRLYAFSEPDSSQDPLVDQVAQLLGGQLQKQSAEQLVVLLGHADQRVRLEAQFALVGRQEQEKLESVVLSEAPLLARLHALWGLGQLAEAGDVQSSLWNVLIAAAGEVDEEVRAQAIQLLGQHAHAPSFDLLIAALADPSGRVRYFAAQGLGKLRRSEAIAPLLEMLAENANRDPMLRHGGVMGLAGAGSSEQLLSAAGHSSPAARLGILLALRKHRSPAVAHFLNDPDKQLVVEAARAIHDLPLIEALPQLAELLSPQIESEALLRRALNANFRLGGAKDAAAVAHIAASSQVDTAMRLEALEMLDQWHAPEPRDRVLGMWRPLEQRSRELARAALRPLLNAVFEGPAELRTRAAQVVAAAQLTEASPFLHAMLRDEALPGPSRAEALAALAQLDPQNLLPIVEAAIEDKDAPVRASARRVLAQLQPDQALSVLEQALYEAEMLERQSALATLAQLKHPGADAVLLKALEKLQSGNVPPDMQLDVLDAAAARGSPVLQEQLRHYEQLLEQDDPLAAYRVALYGGDAERGRQIFFERTEVSCLRCHEIGETGGEVGPDLSDIGAKKTREYLLESIVAPSKTIAENFETVIVVDQRGRIVSGVLKAETDEQLQLMTPEEKLISIDKSTIEERATGQSAMPADLLKHLTRSDVRDLVEFLANQREAPAE